PGPPGGPVLALLTGGGESAGAVGSQSVIPTPWFGRASSVVAHGNVLCDRLPPRFRVAPQAARGTVCESGLAPRAGPDSRRAVRGSEALPEYRRWRCGKLSHTRIS